jgi:hypothetical protein
MRADRFSHCRIGSWKKQRTLLVRYRNGINQHQKNNLVEVGTLDVMGDANAAAFGRNFSAG